MTSKPRIPGVLNKLRSIRWRLPLTYLAIVLLTVVFLSATLLIALDSYYTAREEAYLLGNAQAAARLITDFAQSIMHQDSPIPDGTTLSLFSHGLSFLSRARVRVLNPAGDMIFDSASYTSPDILFVSAPLEIEPGLITSMQVVEQCPPQEATPDGTEIIPAELCIDIDNPERPPHEGRFDYRLVDADAPFGYRLAMDGVPMQEAPHSDVVVSVPLETANGALLGYLELSEGPALGIDVVNSVIRQLVTAALVVIPAAVVIGWVISRNISQPVLVLTGAARRMAKGDLAARVQLDRVDELGTLAETFNSMADNIERTITTLKQFVADAAHEIMTPITAMRTNLELAATTVDDPDVRTDLELAQHELQRLQKLTRSLMTLARLESARHDTQTAPLDLAELVRQVTERFASRAEQAQIDLLTNGAAQPVIISGEQQQFVRVLDNLVENAVKFTPAGGTITLNLSTTPQGTALLLVEDTGIGIPPDDLPRLFARFHRGRNAAAYPGNGLGLVIVKTIVEEHGGTIDVTSSSAGGTQFVIELPLNTLQDDTP